VVRYISGSGMAVLRNRSSSSHFLNVDLDLEPLVDEPVLQLSDSAAQKQVPDYF
jgi:hypothetical protein